MPVCDVTYHSSIAAVAQHADVSEAELDKALVDEVHLGLDVECHGRLAKRETLA